MQWHSNLLAQGGLSRLRLRLGEVGDLPEVTQQVRWGLGTQSLCVLAYCLAIWNCLQLIDGTWQGSPSPPHLGHSLASEVPVASVAEGVLAQD